MHKILIMGGVARSIEDMLTYEDITDYFLKAAAKVALMAHPEYWTNTRSLEREFACVCHTGSCEEAEQRSACTISFAWATLDTALSLEGPAGICDFFHEPDEDCPHLHTRDIPPLIVDLSYNLPLSQGVAPVPEMALLSLMQTVKLQVSEHSSRAVETRPGVSLVLQDSRLLPEALTIQQRVELPIWHPEGMRGLHDDYFHHHADRPARRRRREVDEQHEEGEIVADNPRPEDWLPQVMMEICQDILQVLQALDAVRSQGLLRDD